MQIQHILKHIKHNGKYINTTELLKEKVHTKTIRFMVEQCNLEQIKRGLYRRNNCPNTNSLPMINLTPPWRSPMASFVSPQPFFITD